jgi:GGDEF domain-containing protein
MPRRQSLDLSAPSPGDPAARSGPSADHVIAGLALFVAALLGAAGLASGDEPALFAVAAAVVAVPPVCAILLTRRARHQRRVPTDDTRRRSAWDESAPDPLTGVPVRADFDRELQRVLRRGEPDVTVLRLALVPVGGRAATVDLRRRLVLAAVNWQEALRPEDRLARVADDRFAVILRDCPLAAAARVIDRLRDATPPGTVCAVGAATWDRQESADALVARATTALEATPQLQGGDVLRHPVRVAAARSIDIVAARHGGAFDRAAKSLAWLLHLSSVTIAVVDDRFAHVIGAYGPPDVAVARASTIAEDTLGHQSLVTGRPLVASDASRHPALFDHRLVAAGAVAACATVPLVSVGGEVVGTMCVTRTDHHSWTADELRMLRSTAARVSIDLASVPRAAAA